MDVVYLCLHIKYFYMWVKLSGLRKQMKGNKKDASSIFLTYIRIKRHQGSTNECLELGA